MGFEGNNSLDASSEQDHPGCAAAVARSAHVAAGSAGDVHPPSGMQRRERREEKP